MVTATREKILIVDDVPLNVMVLERALRKDYEIATASSGEEALEMLEPFSPDVVLLDVMMPGLDGYETCRHMRANSGQAELKIIMVSARAMQEDIQAGLDSGADDYLVKPFKAGDIRARIRTQLNR